MNVSSAVVEKPENGAHDENPMKEDKPHVRGLINIKEDTQSDIHAFPTQDNPSVKQAPDKKHLMKNAKPKQDD